MTEKTIQNALFGYLLQRGNQLSVPNYTPVKWHECDMLAITKAGYSVEFEIKISRSDFKADASKEGKHRSLALGDPNGPSRFFYVVPQGMIAVEEVPYWAGLIYADERESSAWWGAKAQRRIVLKEVKKAPKLHTVPIREKVVDHIRGVFYWRFWNLRRGLPENQEHEA
jgi:hypothetical protein